MRYNEKYAIKRLVNIAYDVSVNYLILKTLLVRTLRFFLEMALTFPSIFISRFND